MRRDGIRAGPVVSGVRSNGTVREIACMIDVDGASYCIDPAGGIAEALGKKWTLPLIGVLGNRPKNRFNKLLDSLEGIGSKALADRLRELQTLGVVSREVFAEVPARVEYRLTPKGLQLRRALVPLLAWAAEQDSKTGAPVKGPPGRRN
jgi:DNA-binding HxlR family transcriptional regulator